MWCVCVCVCYCCRTTTQANGKFIIIVRSTRRIAKLTLQPLQSNTHCTERHPAVHKPKCSVLYTLFAIREIRILYFAVDVLCAHAHISIVCAECRINATQFLMLHVYESGISHSAHNHLSEPPRVRQSHIYETRKNSNVDFMQNALNA